MDSIAFFEILSPGSPLHDETRSRMGAGVGEGNKLFAKREKQEFLEEEEPFGALEPDVPPPPHIGG